MPNGNGNGTRLDSWKEIATYLGRDVRTAIRWERDKGLPVRRVPGGQRQPVFAFTAELDTWLTRESVPDERGTQSDPQGLKPALKAPAGGTSELVPFPNASHADSAAPQANPDRAFLATFGPAGTQKTLRAYHYAAILILLASVLATLLLLHRRTQASAANHPVRAALTYNSLQAFDAEGKVLWSYALPGVVASESVGDGRRQEDGIRIADFLGDGNIEVLALLDLGVGPNAAGFNHSEVDMFSSQGKLLWSYVPHTHLVFSSHDLQDKWLGMDILVTGGKKKQIWAAIAHNVWGHSFVVSLDPESGKDTLRYVNTGTIFSVSELTTPFGSFLLASGFNNEYDSGSLAVIDESKPFAVSPQNEGHNCLNCAKGDPDYYFVFPRSELNHLVGYYEDRIFRVDVTEHEIQLQKKEADSSIGAQTIYVLSTEWPIRPVSVSFDTNYDLLHDKFEREGKLNHSRADCPERLHPRPIKMWSPEAGWSEITLPGRSPLQ